MSRAPLLRFPEDMNTFIDSFADPQQQAGKTSHRLLGGWRDIYEDIQALFKGVGRLPDH